MSQRQAAWTSVGEYFQRREAYEKRQQLEWEQCRWVAYSIFSPFLGKNRPSTPDRWVQFPWERHRHIAPMITIDESQRKALNDIYIDFHKKRA